MATMANRPKIEEVGSADQDTMNELKKYFNQKIIVRQAFANNEHILRRKYILEGVSDFDRIVVRSLRGFSHDIPFVEINAAIVDISVLISASKSIKLYDNLAISGLVGNKEGLEKTLRIGPNMLRRLAFGSNIVDQLRS